MLRRLIFFVLLIAVPPLQALAQAEVLVSIEPTLKRERNGGLLLEAKTNLPDGFEVMVTLASVKGPLLGQVKAKVAKSGISAGPFTNRGAAHPPGVYVVSISSPIPDLQPPSIRKITGQKGEWLTGAYVRHDSYGNRVDFNQNVKAP